MRQQGFYDLAVDENDDFAGTYCRHQPSFDVAIEHLTGHGPVDN
jgi:hypothetical protein